MTGIRLAVVAIVLVLGVAGAAFAGARPEVHSAISGNAWQVIAHRGGGHLWPDDTMLAFSNAVALGVDALEMDVHATSDGVLVVIHDETVDRTTNGSGYVKEMTFDEIRALDAGYNWPLHEESDTHPYRDTGVRIPTLEEVLQAFPDVPMVIEIKQLDPPIVDQFGAMLDRYHRVDNTIVASFHPEVMDEFRSRYPQYATSGVEPEIKRFFTLNLFLLGRFYRPVMDAFQVPETSGNLTVVRPRFVRVARSRGIAIQVWTVNEVEDMERILSSGVDGIITDRPDRLLELLGRSSP
jgi:glycerophosphoryl diester phosphodiesterase